MRTEMAAFFWVGGWNSAVSRFHENMFSCSELVICIQMGKFWWFY